MNPDLCFGFSVQDWNSLSPRLHEGDENAWATAVGVLERRMRERYFSCIEALEVADTKPDVLNPDSTKRIGAADSSRAEEERHECIPGFAIMGLCCLLIESIQEFREEREQVNIPQGRCTFPQGRCIAPGSGTNERVQGVSSTSCIQRSVQRGLGERVLHRHSQWHHAPGGNKGLGHLAK